MNNKDAGIIKFTIRGIPKTKARPRIVRKGDKIITYSPSAKYEKDFLSLCFQYMPDEPIKEPIKIICNFYMPIPTSFSKKKKLQAKNKEIRPVVRPDIDNLLKLVLDALNNRFFLDDKQVVSLSVEKFYSEIPRTEVEIIKIKEAKK